MAIDPATPYVALLRGINVGGKHRLPMEALRDIFLQAGAPSVRTYLQSGNALFSVRAGGRQAAERLCREVERLVNERHGFEAPIVVRSVAQLAQLVRSNPFLKDGASESELAVLFLQAAPSARALAALDPKRSPGDAFAANAGDVFLHLPNGAARTRLTTAYFDRALGTVSTARNWRTVVALSAG